MSRNIMGNKLETTVADLAVREFITPLRFYSRIALKETNEATQPSEPLNDFILYVLEDVK